MIKYERAWNKLHPNMVGMAVEKTEKDFIHFLLQKQIDEDNKRFLGELRKIGSITLSCQHFDGLYVPLEEIMKLRDKVNKK